mmetsp:Transcript_2022/g.3296  ORF Transcript_2022/g.3296 Transcript_2022/m.3296 type:complete len:213 (-) Transcript_2022:2004-2642(-)
MRSSINCENSTSSGIHSDKIFSALSTLPPKRSKREANAVTYCAKNRWSVMWCETSQPLNTSPSIRVSVSSLGERGWRTDLVGCLSRCEGMAVTFSSSSSLYTIYVRLSSTWLQETVAFRSGVVLSITTTVAPFVHLKEWMNVSFNTRPSNFLAAFRCPLGLLSGCVTARKAWSRPSCVAVGLARLFKSKLRLKAFIHVSSSCSICFGPVCLL